MSLREREYKGQWSLANWGALQRYRRLTSNDTIYENLVRYKLRRDNFKAKVIESGIVR